MSRTPVQVPSPHSIMLAWRSRRVFSSQSGQGLAEYALILALIAIVAIIALIFLGGQVSKILSNVGHSV
jgi:pilus assembly protein Flp/PilA